MKFVVAILVVHELEAEDGSVTIFLETEDSIVDEQQQTSLSQEIKLLMAFEKQSQMRVQQLCLETECDLSKGKLDEPADEMRDITLPV
jgi:hypothetical protein